MLQIEELLWYTRTSLFLRTIRCLNYYRFDSSIQCVIAFSSFALLPSKVMYIGQSQSTTLLHEDSLA